jgi:hypothetical protein
MNFWKLKKKSKTEFREAPHLALKESLQNISDKFKALDQNLQEKTENEEVEEEHEFKPEEQRVEQESLNLPAPLSPAHPPSSTLPPSSKPLDNVSTPTRRRDHR